MKQQPWRVAALSAVAAAGLVANPVAAQAAPPILVKNTVWEVSCAFPTDEGHGLFLTSSSSSADGTSGAAAFVETTGGRKTLEGENGTASFGSTFAADIPVADFATGEPAGTVVVRAAAVPDGPPTVEQVDEREGNVRTTGTITATNYRFTVTRAEAPRYTVQANPEACSGSQIVFDLSTTNTRYQIIRERHLTSS